MPGSEQQMVKELLMVNIISSELNYLSNNRILYVASVSIPTRPFILPAALSSHMATMADGNSYSIPSQVCDVKNILQLVNQLQAEGRKNSPSLSIEP